MSTTNEVIILADSDEEVGGGTKKKRAWKRKEKGGLRYRLRRLKNFFVPRIRFEFEALDKNSGMYDWNPPDLSDHERHLVKEVWVSLHDGRHKTFGMQVFILIFQRYPKLLSFFIRQTKLKPKTPTKSPSQPHSKEQETPKKPAWSSVKKSVKRSIGERSESIAIPNEDSNKLKTSESKNNQRAGSIFNRLSIKQSASEHARPRTGSLATSKSSSEFGVSYKIEYISNPFFQQHIAKIINAVDGFVKAIDNYADFINTALELSVLHQEMDGIGKAHFRVMFHCFDLVLGNTLTQSEYTRKRRHAMILFFELMYYCITHKLYLCMQDFSVMDSVPRAVQN